MKERLLDSLKCLLIATGIASILIMALLPPGPGLSQIVFFAIVFALILSGPGSAIWVLSTYASDLLISTLVILSSVSFLFWLVLLRNPTAKRWMMYIPIVTWVSVGAFSTFWGLASGV